MVDAVSSVTNIVEIALRINAVVDTARKNRELCRKIGDRTNRLSDILSRLNNTGIMDHPVVRPSLISLEEILTQAFDHVMACQESSIISNLLRGNFLRKQLYLVNNDIKDRTMDVVFAVSSAHLVSCGIVWPISKEDPTVGESGSVNISVGINMDAARSSSPGFRIFSLSELKRATCNFSENSVIGKTGQATVYKGEFSDGLVVAIKRFHDPAMQAPVFQVQLQHENVVRCMGYCHEDSQEMVVEEYTPNGTLSDIIDGLSEQLDWFSALRIIREVADGVAYLHFNRVIHLDLKPDNIVFDPDMNPKICDFEKSKILNQDVTEQETAELVGTLGYIPPEYIADGIISLKSDVFSFGVLLLYTIHRMVKAEHDKHPIVWAWEVREAKGITVLFEPPSLDERQLEELERFIEIGLLCTQDVPIERPTMEHVLEMLKSEHSRENIPIPKKPGFAKDIKARSDHTDCATTDLGSSSH